MMITKLLTAGLLAVAIGSSSGCDRGVRIEVIPDTEFRCGAAGCPGHTIPGHRCSTHHCSHPNCPGHARAQDTCAYYCDTPGCPGHRSTEDRCF